MSFVRVAFPVPLRQTFVYSVPDALLDAAVPGAEVRCPFGARERRGFVVERINAILGHANSSDVEERQAS